MSRGYPQECEGVKRAELKQPACNGNLPPNGGSAGYTSLLLADTDRQTARSVLVTEHTLLGHSGYRPRLVALLVLFLVLLFTSLSGLVFYFNYVAYKPRENLIQEPCEVTPCPLGAECHVTQAGRPVCRCRDTCPKEQAHVCGTDGVTYHNLCELRRSACVNVSHIGVQYPGSCGGIDPCDGLVCRPGARCRVSPDGRHAECHCPSACPDYGDHSGSRPVCGEDGRDYRDMCSLDKASCATENGINIKYQGPCDPCAGVVCAGGEVCLVTEGRVPRCSCPEMCPLEESPVCATDGKTYSNECYMRLEACRSRRQLSVMYRDTCTSGINPCTGLKCEYGSSCQVNREGLASCLCPEDCEEVMRPACGNDGRTYQSQCHMQKQACQERRHVKLAYTGVCGEDGPCTHKNCGALAVCRQTGNTAECVCKDCGSEYEPVCGTDGISYGNACKLRREACLRGRPIDVLYQGLCDGCENKKCDFFATCVSDSAGEAHCVCHTNCTETVGEQVCGTDGVTYRNECELKMTACQNKLNLQTAYKGDCESCAGVVCQYRAKCSGGQCVCPTDCSAAPLEQVCGSDMVTYQSQCELQKRSCEVGDNSLDVLFYGSCERRSHRPPGSGVVGHLVTTPLSIGSEREEACRDVRCDFDATCQLDPEGYPRCVCVFDCQSEAANGDNQQLCGSDLVLYPSACHMRAEACNRQTEIRIRPLDLCQGMEVKPCGGDRPLVDPETGEELDCGNGHNRQDCPTEYYCHQTSSFAKCCRKESGVYLKDCQDSWFGCCPDGKTPAEGPDNEGCPSLCGCNKIGSYSDWCDKGSGECECRPGVGGPKCDRCEPGYWGLPKISSGYKGCLPCGCSLFGSVREDCEQMTGKCVCKPGVSGDKCDVCRSPKQILTPAGCVQGDVTTPVPTSCSQLVCYFGAVCEERDNRASCVCAAACPNQERQQVVCGSDGQTYGSECQLVLYACKYQLDIAVASLGPCKDTSSASMVTDAPAKRWTSYSLMASPLSKSTRHLLQDKYNLPGRSRDVYIVEGHVTTVAELGSTYGGPCTYDSDCITPRTNCGSQRTCQCKHGHKLAPDKTQCVAEEVPSFSGTSWLRLRRIKAYHKFSLELDFKTYNHDGILFYTQQHPDGTGDFLSLAIVNGYVVLNYNLGSGTVRVSSLGRVSLSNWHRVKVRRYERDALLQVDDHQPVAGQSQGVLTALDLGQHPYLGYIPTNYTKVYQNSGTDLGLVGCLKWSQRLEPEEGHLIGVCSENPCESRPCLNAGTCIPVDGVPTCRCQENFTGEVCEELLNPCAYSVCVPGTHCKPQEEGGFECDCSKQDPTCDTGDLESVSIEKGSFIKLPRLEGVSRALSIEIWFMPFTDDGVLLYNSQSQHGGKGDFISLHLHQGHLIFSFSLGGNPAVIQTNETLTLGSWHRCHISRTDKDGYMRVNSGSTYKGKSGGEHIELNLEQPLYIARSSQLDETARFSGVIQRLEVNGHRLTLAAISQGQEVSLYRKGACYDDGNPCLNNGTCLPVLDTFKCVCSHKTTGETCEIVISDDEEGLYFDGNTVIKYPRKLSQKKNDSNYEDNYFEYEEELLENREEEIEEEQLETEEEAEEIEEEYEYETYIERRRGRRGGTRLEIWCRTEEANGALIVGKTVHPPGWWGVLAVEGRTVFAARVGDKHVTLTSKIRLDDGRWHHITAARRRRGLSLQVDGEEAITMSVRHNVAGYRRFWIGGSPAGAENLPEMYSTPYNGCLRGLMIGNKRIDLASTFPSLRTCVDNNVR
ncbi:agrin-like isoform X3 [Rhodnius prolixus]|uniref:agrin-like isoform X3 n=1 Tax=Rhodnius prolixus TaxID=13249 RepID=UPI003D187F9C